MKIQKDRLKQIIKEEINKVLNENSFKKEEYKHLKINYLPPLH